MSLMFNLNVFGNVNEARVFLIQRITMVANIFGNPYTELADLAREIMKVVSSPPSMKWEYVTDSTTGIKILKSEKDPEALDRVRQMADELFK